MNSARGPKPKTPENSRPTVAISGLIQPVSPLKAKGKREFGRLVSVLRRRGTLDKVDVGTITEAARVKELLDAEYASNAPDVKAVGLLTNLRRGCLRELGLTLQPSRATYRTSGGHAPSADPRARWGHLLGSDD